MKVVIVLLSLVLVGILAYGCYDYRKQVNAPNEQIQFYPR